MLAACNSAAISSLELPIAACDPLSVLLYSAIKCRLFSISSSVSVDMQNLVVALDVDHTLRGVTGIAVQYWTDSKIIIGA